VPEDPLSRSIQALPLSGKTTHDVRGTRSCSNAGVGDQIVWGPTNIDILIDLDR
jgi:hypothetical protein